MVNLLRLFILILIPDLQLFFCAFPNSNHVHTCSPICGGYNRAKTSGMQGKYMPAIHIGNGNKGFR